MTGDVTDPRRLIASRAYAQLAIAILAVSSAAVLVRYAEASPLALSFWRTAGGAFVLGLTAKRVARSQLGMLAVAGTSLALHFWAWLHSLTLTSVAASTTLVSTAPLFIAAASPRRIRTQQLAALVMALVGTVIIAGLDVSTSSEALRGDLFALSGAAFMAVYLVVGERLRTDLDAATTSAYTYAIAAGVLLIAATATSTPLLGLPTSDWWVIAAMIAGPQLLGHTVLNHLLSSMGSFTTSLALLLEPVGAGLLAWLLLAEAPTIGVWIGAPLVIGALVLQSLQR